MENKTEKRGISPEVFDNVSHLEYLLEVFTGTDIVIVAPSKEEVDRDE